jgi:hypothetical protein
MTKQQDEKRLAADDSQVAALQQVIDELQARIDYMEKIPGAVLSSFPPAFVVRERRENIGGQGGVVERGDPLGARFVLALI